MAVFGPMGGLWAMGYGPMGPAVQRDNRSEASTTPIPAGALAAMRLVISLAVQSVDIRIDTQMYRSALYTPRFASMGPEGRLLEAE